MYVILYVYARRHSVYNDYVSVVVMRRSTDQIIRIYIVLNLCAVTRCGEKKKSCERLFRFYLFIFFKERVLKMSSLYTYVYLGTRGGVRDSETRAYTL